MMLLTSLILFSFASATECTNPIATDPLVLEVINDPQFRNALYTYESIGEQLDTIYKAQFSKLEELKIHLRVAQAANTSSLLSTEEENIYQSAIEDTLVAIDETLKPLKTKYRMAKGMLTFFEGKLTEAGYSIYYLKARETWHDPERPDATEARFYARIEDTPKEYAHLSSSPKGRFYIVGKNNDIIARAKESRGVIVSTDVIAVTYAQSFLDFIGLSYTETNTDAAPRLMNTSISYAPNSYVSSELFVSDFIPACE